MTIPANELTPELFELLKTAADKADLDITDEELRTDHHRVTWYTWLAQQAYNLGRAHEGKHLIGVTDDDFDGDPAGYGLLDRITVGVSPANDDGRRLVYTRCHGGCGEEQGGTVMLIARDFDGSQAALTLAELAHGALRHIGEEHDGVADWDVLTISDDGRPVETRRVAALSAEPVPPGEPDKLMLRWDLQVQRGDDWIIRDRRQLTVAHDPQGLACLIADQHLTDRPAELVGTPWRVYVWDADDVELTAETALARVTSGTYMTLGRHLLDAMVPAAADELPRANSTPADAGCGCTPAAHCFGHSMDQIAADAVEQAGA